ncbi:hypothetical protein HDU98_003458 [Podochytrium sp. JEL0797]|nr:hypothetical protein HDU98_003458 [Podochytrium sp. JEL0797]
MDAIFAEWNSSQSLQTQMSSFFCDTDKAQEFEEWNGFFFSHDQVLGYSCSLDELFTVKACLQQQQANAFLTPIATPELDIQDDLSIFEQTPVDAGVPSFSACDSPVIIDALREDPFLDLILSIGEMQPPMLPSLPVQPASSLPSCSRTDSDMENSPNAPSIESVSRSDQRKPNQPLKSPRSRLAPHRLIRSHLIKIFEENHTPDTDTIRRAAEEVGMSLRKCQYWFQNRRAAGRRVERRNMRGSFLKYFNDNV